MKERNFRRRGSDNDGGEDTTAAKRPNTASARPLSFADEYPVKRSTKPSSGSAMPFNPAPSAGTYTAFTHPIKPSPSCGLRFTSAPSSVPSNVEPQAGTSTALPNLDAISMSQQAELVKKSLVEKLSRLKESVALLCNTEEKLSASLSNVSALKHSLSAINEECIFIQKLRVLVCGICVCLQHKAPCIEELEDKMQKLHKERAAAILERRAADSDDGMKELVDDESDTESNAYRSQRDRLIHSAKQIFGDNHEYSEFSAVVEKFYRWKNDYPSSYHDAHLALYIPAIFSPYVRLELLKWDPLHENANFSNMKWYTLLRKYGLSTDESPNSFDGADANLDPLVVKFAMPILHNRLAQCWDVFSTRETKCAVFAIKLVFGGDFLYTVPSYVDLVNTLHERLDNAIANLTAPALDSVVMEAVLDAAAAYRFGMSIRLICNICLFRDGGILTMPVIEELALDKLLCGKILPYLRGIQANIHDAIMSTEKVVSLMGIFAGPSVTGDRSPKLQPLVDYVLELKKGLKEKHCSFGQEIWSHFDCFSADKRGEELATAKSLPYLHKMLQALKEDNHAKEISRTYFETEDPF